MKKFNTIDFQECVVLGTVCYRIDFKCPGWFYPGPPFFCCNNIYHYEVLFILFLVVSVKHHTSYTFYYFMIYSLIHVLVHSFVFHFTGGGQPFFSRCVCDLLMISAVAILAQANKAPTGVTKIYLWTWLFVVSQHISMKKWMPMTETRRPWLVVRLLFSFSAW